MTSRKKELNYHSYEYFLGDVLQPEASAQHPGLHEPGGLQTAALSGRNGLKMTTDWYAYARRDHSAFPYQSSFDVILYGGENGDIPIIAWDFKTGGAKLTKSRIEHLHRVSGLDIPIIELRGE